MNAIVKFRKCTLTDDQLLKAVDNAVDEIYKKAEVGDYSPPYRHIPARPNSDFDLLVGELILRFQDLKKKI